MTDTAKRQMHPAMIANMGKGRPKGAVNKTTSLAKQAIAEAFEKLGGTKALVEWAQSDDDNLKVFYATIWPKIIPVQTELTGADGGPIEYEQVNEDADAFRRRLLSGLTAGAAAGGAGETVQ